METNPCSYGKDSLILWPWFSAAVNWQGSTEAICVHVAGRILVFTAFLAERIQNQINCWFHSTRCKAIYTDHYLYEKIFKETMQTKSKKHIFNCLVTKQSHFLWNFLPSASWWGVETDLALSQTCFKMVCCPLWKHVFYIKEDSLHL